MIESGTLQYQQKVELGQFQVWSGPPGLSTLPLRVCQVHGTDIISTNSTLECSAVKADGLIHFRDGTDNKGGPSLAIVTADCLPILFWGTTGYGMLHAGWRGVAGGILLNPEITKLAPTNFVIGPHICQKCYQVAPDFINNFPNDRSFSRNNGQLFFSLQDEVKGQIQEQFPSAKVQSMNLCTFHDSKLHSYRRNKTDLRNWNVVVIDNL
ncbi:MAG: polyphenol oxidase family protein [Bdellovibrionales bacterium]|jgi:polyphenol oxidase|nr:polyphenol oxidase family protein [Bdellovibrionales bacterium]MBT3525463.1 polyphenol oxidase family protein [Bdellovibrionales bacterium]MBT7768104.1 polyphenol oxidase family protein [Bdellovibrionales bacterium]